MSGPGAEAAATERPFPQVRLSVVIPIYNEAANVEANLHRAVRALRRIVGAFELIVIDDASTDGSGEVARYVAATCPEVRVERNGRNLKQGGSLRRGFSMARLDWVMHNAIDYPFDFCDLPLLLAHAGSADVIVARRRSYPGVTVPRLFVSKVNRALIRLLFRTWVQDYNFVQIYRRSVLESLGGRSESTSFVTAEAIVRAIRRGHRVVEVEVPYHARERGHSTSGTWANVRHALRDMARVRLELWRERRW